MEIIDVIDLAGQEHYAKHCELSNRLAIDIKTDCLFLGLQSYIKLTHVGRTEETT